MMIQIVHSQKLKPIALKDDPNYAEAIGKGGKTVDQFKKDKNVKTLVSTAENTITTDSDPVVGEPTVTTTFVDATADTLLDDGRTKRETTRTYTHTSKTPSTVTTTTYNQYTYTYSDGTTNVAKGPRQQRIIQLIQLQLVLKKKLLVQLISNLQ